MIRIQECKGVPVVCLKDEGRLGFVSTPLYNEQNSIKGFLIESENGFTGKFRKKYILLDDVLKLNDSVCVVYSKDSVRKYENKKALTTQNALEQVMGQGVLSKKGKKCRKTGAKRLLKKYQFSIIKCERKSDAKTFFCI